MTNDQPEPGHECCDGDYCHGRKRQEPGWCHRPLGWGTDHPGTGKCKLHLGATPNHATAARMEIARRAMDTYGLPRQIDPADALLEEVHRTAGHVAWLQIKVADLDEDDLVWGRIQEVDRSSGEFGGTDTTQAAKPHVWLQLYQAERKHLAEVCKTALAAGVAERQIRLAEQQGAMLAGVIGRILDDLELTREQRGRVAEVVPRHLRSVG